jgi:hypothetical protein
MQPDGDFLVSFRDAYVFSVVVLYPFSLTARFSEVYGGLLLPQLLSGLLVGSQKTAEVGWACSGVVNTQLKQGVNERGQR